MRHQLRVDSLSSKSRPVTRDRGDIDIHLTESLHDDDMRKISMLIRRLEPARVSTHSPRIRLYTGPEYRTADRNAVAGFETSTARAAFPYGGIARWKIEHFCRDCLPLHHNVRIRRRHCPRHLP